MIFNNSIIQSEALKTRTSEGLGLELFVSYQYLINKENLTQLYDLANTNYQGTYNRIARDTILKVASDYTAEEYWLDRKKIGNRMQKDLNDQLNQVFAK